MILGFTRRDFARGARGRGTFRMVILGLNVVLGSLVGSVGVF